jgi:RND family efflux transporter MFP subunit
MKAIRIPRLVAAAARHVLETPPKGARHWTSLVAVGASVVAIGCTDASAHPTSGANEGKPVIEVEVASAAKRDISRRIQLPVQLFPWQHTDVVAKVTGYIRTVLVDRGSQVKQGDVLATVWDPELEVELSHEQAEVTAAEKELVALTAKRDLHQVIAARYSALIPDRAATQTQADIENANYTVTAAEAEKAKATVTALKERVRTTQTLLGYTTVRAPFDGIVTERFVHEGTFVELGKGTLLFHMVQLNVLRATIDVPEASSPLVLPGTRVAVQFAELGPEWTELTVARSAQELDVKTRTLRVEADLTNPTGRFQPGMYGQSMVTLEQHKDAVTVPLSALLREGGDSVLVVDKGVATRVPIEVGLIDDTSVEARSGLEPNRVVISPVRGIPEGAPVKVRTKTPPAGGPGDKPATGNSRSAHP